MDKRSENKVLKEIYEKSQKRLELIHRMLSKVYDDELALELNKQAVKLSRMEEKVLFQIRQRGMTLQPPKASERLKRWGTVELGTLLNTSTGHVAEMIIRENSHGMTEVMKVNKRKLAISNESVELAEEFMDLSERSIKRLKSYVK